MPCIPPSALPGSQVSRLRLRIILLTPLALRSSDSNRITPLAFLDLQLADGISWDFSASVIA
jgi:hypothetical protein